MTKLLKAELVFTIAILIAGSTTALAMTKKQTAPALDTSIQAKDTVWVAKPASTKQCEKKEATELEAETDAAHNELVEKKIWVLGRKMTKDKAIHIQQCGSPTGEMHGFLIQRKDLDTALEIGFRQVPAP